MGRLGNQWIRREWDNVITDSRESFTLGKKKEKVTISRPLVTIWMSIYSWNHHVCQVHTRQRGKGLRQQYNMKYIISDDPELIAPDQGRTGGQCFCIWAETKRGSQALSGIDALLRQTGNVWWAPAPTPPTSFAKTVNVSKLTDFHWMCSWSEQMKIRLLMMTGNSH